MEIFLSKYKVIRAILLGLMLTAASAFAAAKVFLDAANRSVLTDFVSAPVFSYIVGIISVLGFIIFGTMTAVFISRLFDHKPQLILTLKGIEDKRLGCGMIAWEEIEAVTFMETKNAQWLTLILKAPEKFYDKLSSFQKLLRKLNGQTGNNSLRIRFADLNISVEDAWQFIEENVIKPREEKMVSKLNLHIKFNRISTNILFSLL